MHEHSPGEKILVKVDLERHGYPVETVSLEFLGQVDRPEVARRIAALLELEAEEILEELANPEVLHPEGRQRSSNEPVIVISAGLATDGETWLSA